MLFTLLQFLLQTTAKCDVILLSLDTAVSKSVVWSGTFTPIILILIIAVIYRKSLKKFLDRQKTLGKSALDRNYFKILFFYFDFGHLKLDWKRKYMQ